MLNRDANRTIDENFKITLTFISTCGIDSKV